MGRENVVLSRLGGRVIASVQAAAGEPLDDADVLARMGESAVMGGAAGVRMAGLASIHAFRKRCPDVPVMGITKPPVIPANYQELVYITPTLADAAALAAAGVEIVAMDATARSRPDGDTLASIVSCLRREHPDTLLMADIATLDEGLAASALGFDLISTTLSGYTADTADSQKRGPDFDLLAALVAGQSVPVVLEGRVWEPAEVREGFSRGAYAVVIGSAISRPHEIVRRFCEANPAK